MDKRYEGTDLVTLARQKLDKVYQGNESIEQYIDCFVCLISDVKVENEMQELDKLHLFVKGRTTPKRFASTVNSRTGKPFTDLDDLCTFVTSIFLVSSPQGALEGYCQGKQRANVNSSRAERNKFFLICFSMCAPRHQCGLLAPVHPLAQF